MSLQYLLREWLGQASKRLPLIQNNASDMTLTASRLGIWFFRTSVCSFHLWHGQIVAKLQVEAVDVEVTYERTTAVFFTKVTNKLAQAVVILTCVRRWAFWLLAGIPAIPALGFCSFPQPVQGDARMVSSLYSFVVYLVVLSVVRTVWHQNNTMISAKLIWQDVELSLERLMNIIKNFSWCYCWSLNPAPPV